MKHTNIETTPKRLPLPVGVSDFKKMVDGYYYVDKTLMIKDFLDTRPQVSLFTRPRRFGKTLTMNMFQTFFEISEEDTSKYFIDKKIWNCGERKIDCYDGNAICDIAIPNKEIFFVYEKEILSALSSVIPQSTAIAVR